MAYVLVAGLTAISGAGAGNNQCLVIAGRIGIAQPLLHQYMVLINTNMAIAFCQCGNTAPAKLGFGDGAGDLDCFCADITGIKHADYPIHLQALCLARLILVATRSFRGRQLCIGGADASTAQAHSKAS